MKLGFTRLRGILTARFCASNQSEAHGLRPVGFLVRKTHGAQAVDLA
jgi:hypothetical protein